jgi:hypothetical protein
MVKKHYIFILTSVEIKKATRFPNKLVFRVTTNESNIIIKFSETYSEEAHKACTLAPKLFQYEELPNNWKVIVMEGEELIFFFLLQ